MFERIRIPLSALFVVLVLAGCGSAEPTTAPTRTSPLPTATPSSGAYLDQEPPGTTAEVFAPGIVSRPDSTEFSGTFSPDGREYYFYRVSEDSSSQILFSKAVDGGWTAPEQLPATAGHDAYTPHLTLDNKRLYFAWRRPAPEGQPGSPSEIGIYVVKRTRTGWSKPDFAGQGMFPSSSRDGQMYITDKSSLSKDGQTYLATIKAQGGLFTDYKRLPIKTDWGSPAHPCIAPDGSYLLFDVGGGTSLFVSFREADGTWGAPIDLAKHGFDPLAGGAYVSPDGKYLFFALRDDIWWVDARVIEDLRPKE
jgi:hypothetical protein